LEGLINWGGGKEKKEKDQTVIGERSKNGEVGGKGELEQFGNPYGSPQF